VQVAACGAVGVVLVVLVLLREAALTG